MLSPGTILQATALMDDPFFEGSTVLITEYNENGAMGFVTNKFFERSFNELVQFSSSKAFPLYEGGPVEKESLYFIHQRPDLIDGGIQISGKLYFGGDFEQVVEGINTDHISDNEIRLFIGYCGWDAGELEEEIAEGGWETGAIHSGFLF